MSRPSTQPISGSFQCAHGESPDWERVIEQCLQQLGYITDDMNVGFLYVTDPYADLLPMIVDRFRLETGIAHWIGTVGMGICSTGREYYETPAMSVMVGALPSDGFRILPTMVDIEDARLTSMRDWLDGNTAHLGVVHGDPRNTATPEIISTLVESLPGGFLVGGLSSSRGDCPQIADTVTKGGVSGALFSDRIPVASALTQGCSPIADKHVITECERNVIVTLDNRPALEVFYEDIGEILARDLNRVAGYIFIALPVAASDTGDYLVRNLVGVDSKNQLLAVGEILTEGQQVQFCRRDGGTAWKDLHRMLENVKSRIHSTPRGGLYFSCLGRGKSLFGDESEEMRAIREHLGDFPLAGFYANGEISNNRLYGYTGVLTLFL